MLNCSIIQTQHIKLLFLDSDYAESGAKIVQISCFAKSSFVFCSLLSRKLRISLSGINFGALKCFEMRNSVLISVSLLLLAGTVSCIRKKELVSVEGGNIKVEAVSRVDGAGEVRAILEGARLSVDSIKRPVIGEASMTLEKHIPESPLMNFAADALLLMARESAGEHIDVAITNKGGLRSNISAGKITFGDIYNVFPFENTLALLTLTGEQLMQLCREIASVGGEAISGMTMVITPQGEFVSAAVGGKPVDPTRNYRVATSDYLSQGNDKMTALSLGTERLVRNDVTIRDLMVQYIKRLAAEGKTVSAECDGRITVKE